MANVTTLSKNEKHMKDIERLKSLFDLCKEYDVATLTFGDVDVTFYKIIDNDKPEPTRIDVVDDHEDKTAVENILEWTDTAKLIPSDMPVDEL